MKRYRRSIVSLISMVVLAVGTASASPAAAEAPDSAPEQPVQLSLGDSWPAGAGASPGGGYVPRLYEALKQDFDCSPAVSEEAVDGCKHLQLVNLAMGGATTQSLIDRQLPDAESLLASRNDDRNPANDVEVITLHIGGNDAFGPIIGACVDYLLTRTLTPGCVNGINTVMSSYRGRLATALSALRDAAGPDTRIVIGTYDNPLPHCQLRLPGPIVFPLGYAPAVELAALALEAEGGGAQVEAGLHDVMREVAGQNDIDVEVAAIFGELTSPTDWVGGFDCLHPDDSGYAKVASVFIGALVS
jgi:hypothetical protein